jgi:hypothetical protein
MGMSLYAPNLPACEISLTMDNVIGWFFIPPNCASIDWPNKLIHPKGIFESKASFQPQQGIIQGV